jgi:hypothetical protein
MVLEAGCGVGAQTIPSAQRSPHARFTSVDVSADSIAKPGNGPIGRGSRTGGVSESMVTAMIEGIREAAIARGLNEPASLDAGVRDLRRTTEEDGVFCYTFFKGVARKSRDD